MQPHALVPAAIALSALASLPAVSAPSTVPYAWKNVVIGGGGYVLDVYPHPKQKDLVYIRTDVGGFYRWDAKGLRWIPLTDAFPRAQSNYYGGEGLAVDPQDARTVYIASGKYLWASPGSIFKSNNQGKTWKKLPIDVKMGGNEDHRWGGQRLAISPQHPRVLLFGARQDGLWRSQDGGAHWNRVSTFPGKLNERVGIGAIAFDPSKPGHASASAFGDAVYETSDDGLTWRKTAGSPAEVERLACAPDGSLYATHAHGVGKFTGRGWIDVTPAGVTGSFGGVSVNPKDSADVVVCAQADHLRLFRTRDAGNTWVEKKTRTESSAPWYSDNMRKIQYVAGVAFDPLVSGRVWLTDWYATYRTDSIGAEPVTFRNFERGHEELVAFTLAAPPAGYPLLSGTADVDGFVHTNLDDFPRGLGEYYGGSGPAFGDTYQIAWCATSPLSVVRVGGKRWDNTGGGALSHDGGKTWASFTQWDARITPGRVAVSATDPKNMVALRIGSGPALFTRDGSATWQNVTGLPDQMIDNPWNWRVPLAADGGNAGTFYVYDSGKLYRSTDGGATFTVSSSNLPSESQCIIQTVPGSAGEVWIALGDRGLWRSPDGGLTFQSIATIKQASLFAPGKRAPGSASATLFLYGKLTDGREGIFRSLDNGVTWDTISDVSQPVGDEPNSITASYQTFGEVFIGTNGRGIYYGVPAGR